MVAELFFVVVAGLQPTVADIDACETGALSPRFTCPRVELVVASRIDCATDLDCERQWYAAIEVLRGELEKSTP